MFKNVEENENIKRIKEFQRQNKLLKERQLWKRKELIFWARVFGLRCCITCKYFNSETLKCESQGGLKAPLFPFLNRKENQFLERYGEMIVGSACPSWE